MSAIRSLSSGSSQSSSGNPGTLFRVLLMACSMGILAGEATEGLDGSLLAVGEGH
jgi:hypothetical protein